MTLGIILVAAIALSAALSFTYFCWARDEPPPNLTDLEVPRPPELPENQNAYALLVRAAAAAQNPLHKTRRTDINALLEGTRQDDALRQELLAHADAQGVWPLVAQALAAPRSQAAWPESFDSEYPETGQLRPLAWLMILRATDEARRGDTRKSLQTLRDIFAIGTVIENGSTTLIHHLTAIAIKTQALDATRRVAITHPLSCDDLRFALATVRASRLNPENTRRTFRMELNSFHLALDNITNPKTRGSFRRLLGGYTPFNVKSLGFDPKLTPLLKRNKTTRLYAERLREVIRLIGQDGTAITTSNIDAPFEPSSKIHQENYLGRVLLNLVSPSWSKLLQTGVRHESAFSATEAFLALRHYALDHDRALPATLDTLVPEYLPSLPRDHADGQPIRYSREFRALWSVGVGEKKLTVTAAGQKPGKGELLLDLAAF